MSLETNAYSAWLLLIAYKVPVLFTVGLKTASSTDLLYRLSHYSKQTNLSAVFLVWIIVNVWLIKC